MSRIYLLLALALLGASPGANASPISLDYFVLNPDGTIIGNIAFPGIPTTINNTGAIAGYQYFPYHDGIIRHPNGTLEFFSVPGATATYVHDINDLGIIAGTSAIGLGADRELTGFLRNPSGSFQTFSYPRPSVDTSLRAVNNAGFALGDWNPRPGSDEWGQFVLAPGGSYADLVLPTLSAAMTLDDRGRILGWGPPRTGDRIRGWFIREENGTIVNYDFPTPVMFPDYGVAINARGQVAVQTRRRNLTLSGGYIFGIDGSSRRISVIVPTNPSATVDIVEIIAINDVGQVLGRHEAYLPIPEPSTGMLLLSLSTAAIARKLGGRR